MCNPAANLRRRPAQGIIISRFEVGRFEPVIHYQTTSRVIAHRRRQSLGRTLKPRRTGRYFRAAASGR